ncbi:SH3b domain-containing protein [Candidatus Magnetomoraceae bacterium gMMP-15]
MHYIKSEYCNSKFYILIILTLCFIVCSQSVSAERLAIKASRANIRSGPSLSNGVVWQAEQYYPLEIIKKKEAWYHFRDFEDDKGWIHESLVGNISTVITKKTKNNVRKGPGVEFDIVFIVEKGVPFKVLKRKGKWINIEHSDGDSGWIYESLVW